MEISKLTEGQAMDMGIVEAAIRQAERHAAGIKPVDPAEYVDADVQHDPTHAEALETNAQVVYVQGHGTRAYILTDVVVYDNGDFLYSVRPLSGGMEWGFDRRAFGTVPFTN